MGAGPGDPGLITVRGLQLVRTCDALVFDRLVSPELVAEAPADALRVPREGRSQEEVSALLVSLGRRGLAVVRLKGGDPLLFGRGGEEALALARAGVPFEIVPGVSSLAAVPGACGIPVTHRGLSSQVTAVSGHDPDALDYRALAQAPGTLVLFMALGHLEEIAARLVAHGRPPDTPAAVIASGTLPEERCVVAPLAAIAAAAADLRPPALVVVGEVVSLASCLARGGARPAREGPVPARADGQRARPSVALARQRGREAGEPMRAPEAVELLAAEVSALGRQVAAALAAGARAARPPHPPMTR